MVDYGLVKLCFGIVNLTFTIDGLIVSGFTQLPFLPRVLLKSGVGDFRSEVKNTPLLGPLSITFVVCSKDGVAVPITLKSLLGCCNCVNR